MSYREKQIPYDFIYMWNLKSKTNEQTKQNRYRYREQTGGYQGSGNGAKGLVLRATVEVEWTEFSNCYL